MNFLTMAEVCERLGITTGELCCMIESGTFPRPVATSILRWPAREVAVFIARRDVNPDHGEVAVRGGNDPSPGFVEGE